MSKIGLWSTTPGSNNATPPDGWPEGQAPSTVNDCAREMMASIRTYIADSQYVDLGNAPSFLTATTFSLGAADVTHFQVGRRLKLFDTTTLYGTINSVSATFVSVNLDSGELTAQLSSVAVAVLSPLNNALPNNVWRRRNFVINGNMNVWQRGSGFGFGTGNIQAYTADRFNYLQSCNAAMNITRSELSAAAANVPTVAQAGVLLTNSLCFSVSAADTSIATGEYSMLSHRIEGFDWRELAQKPAVLSFWAKTNKSGIYAVSLRNNPVSASFMQNFTISAVNTWSRFSITVPESPTTITWNYDTGIGVDVCFVLAAGATWQGGAGNWTAANVLATSSQVNFLASAGNVMRITGIQFEEGSQATPLEPVLYATELARCQRYYWRGLPAGSFNFPAYTAGCVASWAVKFPQTMRIVPSLSTNFAGITTFKLAGNPTVNQSFYDGCRLVASASASDTNCNFSFISTDYIDADAEL